MINFYKGSYFLAVIGKKTPLLPQIPLFLAANKSEFVGGTLPLRKAHCSCQATQSSISRHIASTVFSTG